MQLSHWIALGSVILAMLGGFCGLAVLMFHLNSSLKDYLDARIDATYKELLGKAEVLDAQINSLSERTDKQFESVTSQFESVTSQFESVTSQFESVTSQIALANHRIQNIESGLGKLHEIHTKHLEYHLSAEK